MSRSPTASRLLIVVPPTDVAVQTVEYALREARDRRAESRTPLTVEIRIVTHGTELPDTDVRSRLEEAVSAFETPRGSETRIDVVTLSGDDSTSRTRSLVDELGTRDVSRLVVAADTDLSVELLRSRLGLQRVELAPTDTSHERRRLLHPGGGRRLGAIFGLTYLFYLAIGGFAGGLDILTGAISAGVVALSLSHVALSEEPTVSRTGRRLVRMVVFLPVLLWEVVKANVSIAAIILTPSLPVDPSMDVVETETREALERMVLANSITLTPGTLVVDVREEQFTVHSLTAASRIRRGETLVSDVDADTLVEPDDVLVAVGPDESHAEPRSLLR